MVVMLTEAAGEDAPHDGFVSVRAMAAAVALMTALLVVAAAWRRSKSGNLPPCRSGWIPWLGAGIAFGKAPLHYIESCRNELGDIFTIHAAGKKMTFLCSHSDHAHFYQTPHADFQAAVQPFTERAAGIPFRSFYQHHTNIHDTIKGRLTPQYMSEMCPLLSERFHHQLKGRGESATVELMEFVRCIMFPAVVQQLFGPENLKLSQDEMLQLQNTFAQYDLDFEYGAELPPFIMRQWSGYRQWLLNFFTSMVSRMSNTADKPQHLVDQLVSMVDSASAPGYSLLLLWASQANAIPIAYWTIAFILSHSDVLSDIKQELADWQLVDQAGQLLPVSETQLKHFPTIKRALMESIRLRAPGTILRKVTHTHTIRGYTIPRGHLLMLSPYWSHRDTDRFPDPETFNPDRWKDSQDDKPQQQQQFLPGFNGFGGGRYHCPGRWFALMELQLVVAMTIKMFDMQLLDTIPQPSPLHLVGSQQPSGQCRIQYQLRRTHPLNDSSE